MQRITSLDLGSTRASQSETNVVGLATHIVIQPSRSFLSLYVYMSNGCSE